jgi:hypothetical protein
MDVDVNVEGVAKGVADEAVKVPPRRPPMPPLKKPPRLLLKRPTGNLWRRLLR